MKETLSLERLPTTAPETARTLPPATEYPVDRSVSESPADERTLSSTKTEISVVIPLFNEADSLSELHRRLTATLQALGRAYEILFVDDGSRDGSSEVIREIRASDPHCRSLRFRRNLGKAAALEAGFQRARGELVFTLDADLQDEPGEIPRFLEKLDEGYDLVSGWKRKRHDPIGKTLPSRFFNDITRRMTGLNIHDFNCGFKLYRSEVTRCIHLYGELHRYVPALAHWKGFRVGEIPVEHHPRAHGQSKYGWERFVRGFLDLITVIFLTRYTRKPLHFFGSLGLLLLLLGMGVNSYLAVLHFTGVSIHDRPLLVLGVLMMILGVQSISTGLIAELIVSHRAADEFSDYLVGEP